jgi:hypothetical protein
MNDPRSSALIRGSRLSFIAMDLHGFSRIGLFTPCSLSSFIRVNPRLMPFIFAMDYSRSFAFIRGSRRFFPVFLSRRIEYTGASRIGPRVKKNCRFSGNNYHSPESTWRHP